MVGDLMMIGLGKRRGVRRRRAAALVELAVVTPVLMTMLFGIIEFGQLFMVRQTCQHAAREGCRAAVLQSTAKPYSNSGGPVMSRISQVMTAAGVEFSPSMVQITEDSQADPTVTITVTVPYDEFSLTHYLGVITDSVHGSCAMRKEGV
jgi:Flp pilus assembly protein TadG